MRSSQQLTNNRIATIKRDCRAVLQAAAMSKPLPVESALFATLCIAAGLFSTSPRNETLLHAYLTQPNSSKALPGVDAKATHLAKKIYTGYRPVKDGIAA